MIVLCAVCFRGGDALARESLNSGIAVLLGVTAAVLACFAVFFVTLARRAREQEAGFDAAVRETGFDTAPSLEPGLQ